MIKVFYDAKCNLCSKEIKYYMKVADANIFSWQDVNDSVEDLKADNITLVQALKFLHVQDLDGKFHIGVDAFILIWRNLKKFRILAFIVSLPIIKQLTDFFYKVFANYRFKKLKHCQVALRNR